MSDHKYDDKTCRRSSNYQGGPLDGTPQRDIYEDPPKKEPPKDDEKKDSASDERG